MVNSWVFKDDESETDAKTNNEYRVCTILVGSPLLAWRVHAQNPLLAHYARAQTHERTHIMEQIFNFDIQGSGNSIIFIPLCVFQWVDCSENLKILQYCLRNLTKTSQFFFPRHNARFRSYRRWLLIHSLYNVKC